MKMLLGRDDINPDKSGVWDQTPLSRATRNGHEGVVEMLLARDDVNPDKPGNSGRTPGDGRGTTLSIYSSTVLSAA